MRNGKQMMDLLSGDEKIKIVIKKQFLEACLCNVHF